MKKTVCALVLSASFTLVQATVLDVYFSAQEKIERIKTSSLCELKRNDHLDKNKKMEIGSPYSWHIGIEEITTYATSTMLRVKITSNNKIISEPLILAEWNKPATIEINEVVKSAAGPQQQHIYLTITPHKW